MSGTITRGKIIRADLAHWDGKTSTHTRLDSTGGTITGLVIDDEVDVLQVFGSGSNRTRTAIAEAIAHISTSAVTLQFAPGTWSITSSLTIPSNFTCRIPRGCVFSVDSGQTLTFNGPVIAESSSFYSGSGTTVLSVDSIVNGAPWYARTSAESAASVTPASFKYQPGELLRQGSNTTPATTDMATAFQAAIDSASALQPEVRFSQECGIGTPLLIKSGTIESIALVGKGKAISIIEPLSADIKVAAQNINCLIFNQKNNPHLRIEDVRFASVASYTGIVIYCKENGGADSSGQALFSPILRNIFCDIPSTNTGFLTGAMQNAVVDSATFENAKGVFTIQGAGSSDCYFTNIALFNSFDHFINQVADTEGSYLMTINGLHAYNHNRGRLIDVQNWNGANISNIVLEPKTGNLGSVGIAKLKNCSNIVIENCIAVKRTDVPQADIAFEIEGSQVKIANCKINAAIGLRISGTSAVDIELDNVEFSESATACIQINGAASGTLRTRNCKFNDSQQRAILHSVVNSMHWYSLNDEFMNAGLDGNAGRRNIDVSTSGVVRLINPTIGQNNGSAAAAYYLEAGGSGTVDLIHPRIVGTPPTGLKTGAQTVTIAYQPGNGGTLASTAALSLPTYGDVFLISGTTNITSIGAANNAGRRVTLVFQGILTFTDGSNLALAGNFVTSADDAITLVCDGTTWYETGRSAN